MNNWLNNENTVTAEPITFAELKAEYQRGFQAGIDFALAMQADDTDFEPMGITYYCSGCHGTEFLTDAEAEKRGWSRDTCPSCIKEDRFKQMDAAWNEANKVKDTESPYLKNTTVYAENAKSIKLGNIIVR